MVYVPDLNSYKCFVVQNDTILRAYKDIPQHDTTVQYRDYYYTSNYLFKDGYQSFSTYSTLPVCLSSSDLTSEVYYRNDFDSILIIFLILSIFGFYIPIKIFSRLFRRFL